MARYRGNIVVSLIVFWLAASFSDPAQGHTEAERKSLGNRFIDQQRNNGEQMRREDVERERLRAAQITTVRTDPQMNCTVVDIPRVSEVHRISHRVPYYKTNLARQMHRERQRLYKERLRAAGISAVFVDPQKYAQANREFFANSVRNQQNSQKSFKRRLSRPNSNSGEGFSGRVIYNMADVSSGHVNETQREAAEQRDERREDVERERLRATQISSVRTDPQMNCTVVDIPRVSEAHQKCHRVPYYKTNLDRQIHRERQRLYRERLRAAGISAVCVDPQKYTQANREFLANSVRNQQNSQKSFKRRLSRPNSNSGEGFSGRVIYNMADVSSGHVNETQREAAEQRDERREDVERERLRATQISSVRTDPQMNCTVVDIPRVSEAHQKCHRVPYYKTNLARQIHRERQRLYRERLRAAGISAVCVDPQKYTQANREFLANSVRNQQNSQKSFKRRLSRPNSNSGEGFSGRVIYNIADVSIGQVNETQRVAAEQRDERREDVERERLRATQITSVRTDPQMNCTVVDIPRVSEAHQKCHRVPYYKTNLARQIHRERQRLYRERLRAAGISAVCVDPQKYAQANREFLANSFRNQQNSQKSFKQRLSGPNSNSGAGFSGRVIYNTADVSSGQVNETQRETAEQIEREEVQRREQYEESWSLAEEIMQTLQEEDVRLERQRLLNAEMLENSEGSRAHQKRHKAAEYQKLYRERIKVESLKNKEKAQALRHQGNERQRRYKERLKAECSENPKLAETLLQKRREGRCRLKERRKAAAYPETPEVIEARRKEWREMRSYYRRAKKAKLADGTGSDQGTTEDIEKNQRLRRGRKKDKTRYRR